MGGGAFYFVENAVQMKVDDCIEFFACRLASDATSLFQVGDQAVECVVLAEEENFVFAAEIVVKIGGGQVGGGGDFAHAGLGEAAGAEFAAGGSKDFEAAGQIAALEARSAHGDRMALRGVVVNGN